MITNKDKTKFKLISKKETLDIIKKPKKSEIYKYRKLFNGNEELICLMSPQEPKSIIKKDKDMDLENKLFTFLENFERNFDSKFNDFEHKFESKLNELEHKFDSKLNDFKQDINSQLNEINNRLDKIETKLNDHIQDFENFKNKIESLPTIQKELKLIQ